MKNVILIDIDGVFITTPAWKSDILHTDGYSDFNAQAVENFNELISKTNAELWLTSSRSINKSLKELNEIFKKEK